MRVLVYYSHNDIREEEWPKPDPAPGEVRVAIKSVGICGSDINQYKSNLPVEQPFVLGHEAAGIIDASGPGVTDWPEGTVVAIEPTLACQKCKFCLAGQQNICPNHKFLGSAATNGALAEYVVVPAENVIKVNAKVSFAEIAMIEPLAIGLHAVNLLGLKAGDTVAVLGAGGIGIAALIAAKLAGARVVLVTDKIDSRLKVADSYGAETTIDISRPEEIQKLSGQVDYIIEATGQKEALASAVELAAPGAKIAVIGIPSDDEWSYPAATARRKEIAILNVRRSNHTVNRAVDFVERGNVDLAAMVSHKLPWSEVEKAFAMAENVEEGTLRIVLEPEDEAEPFYM